MILSLNCFPMRRRSAILRVCCPREIRVRMWPFRALRTARLPGPPALIVSSAKDCAQVMRVLAPLFCLCNVEGSTVVQFPVTFATFSQPPSAFFPNLCVESYVSSQCLPPSLPTRFNLPAASRFRAHLILSYRALSLAPKSMAYVGV